MVVEGFISRWPIPKFIAVHHRLPRAHVMMGNATGIGSAPSGTGA
jgi:hypothetical protein